MKKLVVLAVICLFAVAGNAQVNYVKGIGVRIAPESRHNFVAFDYKTFWSDESAIQLNFGFGPNRRFSGYHPFILSAAGNYQYHFDIPVQGLQWFVGGGIVAYHSFHNNKNVSGFGFGFNATGGVDWKIPKVPISIQADYRPTVFVTKAYGDGFYGTDFGVSARYTF